MEETIRTEKATPEIMLIGVLLLIAGIVGIITDSVELWNIATLWPSIRNTPLFDMLHKLNGVPLELSLAWEILQVPLAGASVVCGVALLCRARWARRAATVVLIALFILGVIPGVVNHAVFMALLRTDLLGAVGSAAWHLFRGVLGAAFYLIMLLFLATSSRQTDINAPQPAPGYLHRFAEKVRGYLPATVPPVIALIALVLISQAISMLFSIVVRDIRQYSSQIPSMLVVILVLIGILVAGLGLLARWQWSWYASVGLLLFIGCVIPILIIPHILPIFRLLSTPGMREDIVSFNLISSITSSVVFLKTSISYAVMALYLFRYRHLRHE